MNWLSFIYGGAVAIVGTLAVIFVTGFGRAAGADAWHLLKKKISPPPQEVKRDFSAGDGYAWVPELEQSEHLARGYQYYKKDRASRFRSISSGKEFYMKMPTS